MNWAEMAKARARKIAAVAERLAAEMRAAGATDVEATIGAERIEEEAKALGTINGRMLAAEVRRALRGAQPLPRP